MRAIVCEGQKGFLSEFTLSPGECGLYEAALNFSSDNFIKFDEDFDICYFTEFLENEFPEFSFVWVYV